MAPGLEEGMTFDSPVTKQSKVMEEAPASKVMSLADIMTLEDSVDDLDIESFDDLVEEKETKV